MLAAHGLAEARELQQRLFRELFEHGRARHSGGSAAGAAARLGQLLCLLRDVEEMVGVLKESATAGSLLDDSYGRSLNQFLAYFEAQAQ